MFNRTQIIIQPVRQIYMFGLFTESGRATEYHLISINSIYPNTLQEKRLNHHMSIQYSTTMKAINQRNTSSKFSLMVFICGVFYIIRSTFHANLSPRSLARNIRRTCYCGECSNIGGVRVRRILRRYQP